MMRISKRLGAILSVVILWGVITPITVAETPETGSGFALEVQEKVSQRCGVQREKYYHSILELGSKIFHSNLSDSEKLRLKRRLIEPGLFVERYCGGAVEPIRHNDSLAGWLYGAYDNLMDVSDNKEFAEIRREYSEDMVAYAEKLGRRVIAGYSEKPALVIVSATPRWLHRSAV